MILSWVEKIINSAEKTSLGIKSWIFSFGAIVAVRLFIEYLAFPGLERTFESVLGAMLHTASFFAISFFVILLILRFLVKEKIEKLAGVLLWGQWIILLPPIIDKIIFKDKYFFSFYIFDSPSGLVSRFFHFFGPNPDFGITYGTRVEVFLAVVLLGSYVYLKTKKVARSLFGALVLYLILFLLGSLPSLFAFVLRPWLTDDPAVKASTVAKIFLSPLSVFSREISDLSGALHYKMSLIYNLVLAGQLFGLLFLYFREKFWALLKNFRYPQTIFNFGLFFIGIGLGWHYFSENMSLDFFSVLAMANLGLAIFSAWFYSVFINDINDQRIDRISNPDRPLIRKIFSQDQYRDFAWVPMAVSLFSAITVGVGFFALIVVYHLLTHIYSCPPFRLKRFALVSTAVASMASVIFLFMGYLLVSGQDQLQNFPWRAGILLFIAYGLVLPLKDIRDYEGDKADGVYTLAVLLGPSNARLALATLVFIFYVASVFIVNETSLFPHALLFGGASYYLISNEKITPKRMVWYVLGVIFLYGIAMGKKIFF